jgi:hypothetical protein
VAPLNSTGSAFRVNDKSARSKADVIEWRERSLIAGWRSVGRLDVALTRRDCRRLDGLRTEPVEMCREGASKTSGV